MNQFAAERYVQELYIRYLSGPRNHKPFFPNKFRMPGNHPN